MAKESEQPIVSSNPLPTLVDVQLSVEKLRIALQVRSTHLRKQKREDTETDKLLDVVRDVEEYVDNRVAQLLKEHPAYPWFSTVKGIGGENIGKVVGMIDIEKAPHVSSLWKYCGMHVSENGTAPKREAGKKLEYNSRLRSMCWRLGSSLLKAKGKFYLYYIHEKEKYTIRYTNEGRQIVPAEQLPKEKGKKVESSTFISEGHIHNMAMRKTIKMFLSMLWVSWRRAEGLPVSEPYPIAHQGHSHIRTPDEWMEKPFKKSKKMKPSMPMYDIWIEGYAAAGERSPAGFEGRWAGDNFADACTNWATLEDRLSLFNKEKLTYRGRRLFDNEKDARRMFG